MFKHKKLVTL